MSDWWEAVGNMAQFFPGQHALAVDMGVNGADPDFVGYGLAYGLQATPVELPVYPSEEPAPTPPVPGGEF